MSGGRFEYKDGSARWMVEEVLDETIYRLKDDDSFEGDQIYRNAVLLRYVSDVLFQWLHDYDLAASHDTSFDTLDEQVKVHLEKLKEIVNENT